MSSRRQPALPPWAAVLVTGHLDSINHEGGPDASAPGADDNGSGSAGVMAMAEAVPCSITGAELDTRFVLFGGEEQGLFGSLAYVDTSPPRSGRGSARWSTWT